MFKWIVRILIVLAVLLVLVTLNMIYREPGAWSGWSSLDFTNRQPAGAFGFHIFDAINCLLLFITLFYVIRSVTVAESALTKSHNAFVQSLVDSRYDAMDRLYFDLLKERRERAHSESAGSSRSGPADPYPLMVWNFIETVIDKCENDPSGELMRTWAPPISAEARDFGDWILDRPALSAYFKNDFMVLAEALVASSRDALSNGEDLDGSVFLRLYRALERARKSAGLNLTDADFLWLFGKLHNEPKFRALVSGHLAIVDARQDDDEVDRQRNLWELQNSQAATLATAVLSYAQEQIALRRKSA